MRRTAMMLGIMMLLVVVAAGTALAVTKTCQNVPCLGSENEDVLYERVGRQMPDKIFGLDGDDDIDANNYGKDRDRLIGDGGSDRLLVNDGDGRDLVRGGRGRNVCVVDPDDTVRGCERVRGDS